MIERAASRTRKATRGLAGAGEGLVFATDPRASGCFSVKGLGAVIVSEGMSLIGKSAF
jgi:hypothetical protein